MRPLKLVNIISKVSGTWFTLALSVVLIGIQLWSSNDFAILTINHEDSHFVVVTSSLHQRSLADLQICTVAETSLEFLLNDVQFGIG